MTVTCRCGVVFNALPSRVKNGRGKYCSQKCKYEFRSMPKRGKGSYVIVKDNPTQFKKGITPWNKGRRDLPPPSNFLKEGVGYYAIHDWINRHRGKALYCEHCGKSEGRIEWANKSHDYKRELDDWISLCKSCHVKYDMASGSWGETTKRFNFKPKKCRNKKQPLSQVQAGS